MKYLLLLISSILFISSCTDVVELDLSDQERVLVVEGTVNDIDSVHWLQLSYTGDYFNPELPDYQSQKNAQVLIFRNAVFLDTMRYNAQNQRFESFFKATEGEVYHIEFKLENGEEYITTPEEIKPVSVIDSIKYIYQTPQGFFPERWQIVIYTQEIPGPGNFYQWRVYLNEEYQSRPFDMLYANDDLVEGNYIANFEIFNIVRERYDELKAIKTGPLKVKVEQMGINRNYFNYLQSFQRNAFVGGPFSPPAAEIKGNVFKKGTRERALGYFNALSIRSIELEIPDNY